MEKAAQHYGQRPCIVDGRIDNEINCEVDVFYSESDTAAFREFLKEKYQTLDALNEALYQLGVGHKGALALDAVQVSSRTSRRWPGARWYG